MEANGGSERHLCVPEGTRPGRADKVLAGLTPDLSRSRWQRLFAKGLVWKEDCVLSQADTLRGGDLVLYRLPDPEPMDLTPVAMNLDVLYEDAHLLVLNKEAGVVVHPGAGTGRETLVHGLLDHCQGSLSGIGGVERPGIVHRLDKETSGVLVVAKTDACHQGLARQFAQRTTRKCYLSLVAGVPSEPVGCIEQPVGRHPVHRMRMACRKDGRPARTDYRLLRHWSHHAALIEEEIHTGRTHQIRVHMNFLGLPLLGDALYGFKEKAFLEATGIAVPRVMLHAARLAFTHPLDNLGLSFEAPLPEDFSGIMAGLERAFPSAESR